ncbi:MAG: hypothetical protein LBM77_05270 [Spirochaetaceae bacterium]|nr:hypothetical protein [Spirochaetaceae bacterium]
MKKIVCLVCLAFCLLSFSTPLYSLDFGDDERLYSMAANIDPIWLFAGAFTMGFGIEGGFEYAPLPWLSARVNGGYFGTDLGGLMGSDFKIGFAVADADVRYYPVAEYVEGFFINAGARYMQLWGNILQLKLHDVNLSMFAFKTGIGYKILTGRGKIVFFIEPAFWWNFMIPSDKIKKDFGETVSQFSLNSVIFGINGPAMSLAMGLCF